MKSSICLGVFVVIAWCGCQSESNVSNNPKSNLLTKPSGSTNLAPLSQKALIHSSVRGFDTAIIKCESKKTILHIYSTQDYGYVLAWWANEQTDPNTQNKPDFLIKNGIEDGAGSPRQYSFKSGHWTYQFTQSDQIGNEHSLKVFNELDLMMDKKLKTIQ